MKPRNILLIGVDQMRADVAGPTKRAPTVTPHLDNLYSKSANFTRAYSSCPLCSPARASMFTGDYAFKHGMGTNCDMYHSLSTELSDPSRLLHLVFQKAGYRTGFIGKWHVGAKLGPADFGFEGMDIAGYGNIAMSPDFTDYLAREKLSYSIKPTIFLNPNEQTMLAGEWQGPAASTPSHYLTNRMMELLTKYADSGDPFFATVQYWDPHQPHLIADEFRGITDRSKIAAWLNFQDDLKGKPRRIARERQDFYRLHPRSEEQLIKYIGEYSDHIAQLDSEIGRLLDWLDSTGLAEETIVIFTSDHGDMTGAHGGLIDKGLLYEEAVRVPLLFRHKTVKAGKREALASNMDILPSVIDLIGLEVPDRHGISLKPELNDPNVASRDSLLIEYHGLRFLYSQRALIRRDGMKFIFTPGDYDELYDLRVDPGETQNLVSCSEKVDDLAKMRSLLISETARLNDPLRDCVAKFNGIWKTDSGQFDASMTP